MSTYFLNEKEHEINENIIRNYLDTWDYHFSEGEKDKIVEDICRRMNGITVPADKIQEFNFVEDAYADAASCYVFSHHYSVDALLNEKDDAKVFECMGMGKPGPEEERE